MSCLDGGTLILPPILKSHSGVMKTTEITSRNEEIHSVNQHENPIAYLYQKPFLLMKQISQVQLSAYHYETEDCRAANVAYMN